jgi:23S rRNA pseudouridine1911/1915/1917 synthase
MAVARPGKGKRAVTHFRVLERFAAATFLECRLETGRTHQIRVHLASVGHPLLGDETYGPRWPRRPADPALADLIARLDGVALHAAALAFSHPATGAEQHAVSPLPNRLDRILSHLRSAPR